MEIDGLFDIFSSDDEKNQQDVSQQQTDEKKEDAIFENVDNIDGYYNEGNELGLEGSDTSKPLLGDFIPPTEGEEAARHRGWEDGRNTKAIIDAHKSED